MGLYQLLYDRGKRAYRNSLASRWPVWSWYMSPFHDLYHRFTLRSSLSFSTSYTLAFGAIAEERPLLETEIQDHEEYIDIAAHPRMNKISYSNLWAATVGGKRDIRHHFCRLSHRQIKGKRHVSRQEIFNHPGLPPPLDRVGRSAVQILPKTIEAQSVHWNPGSLNEYLWTFSARSPMMGGRGGLTVLLLSACLMRYRQHAVSFLLSGSSD